MTAEESNEGPKLGLKEFSVIIMLLVNFGGMIWGAAKLSASVENLKETVGSITTTMQTAVSTLNSQAADVAVLKYRVSQIETNNAARSR